jgi:altronate dehydratase
VVHPNVAAALLLEHGCEKIPNDVMRRQLESVALPLDRYGWVSVQLDGGIEKAITKIEAWFASSFEQQAPVEATVANAGSLTVGLLTSGPVTSSTSQALAQIATEILGAGGSILLPESDSLLADSAFRSALFSRTAPHPTLAYGQPVKQPGLHIVASETDHAVENITGFGGNGAHLVMTIVSEHAQQGHPLLPVVQIAEAHRRGILPADDVDVFLAGEADADAATVRQWLVEVAQRTRVPVANAQGFVDFQLTRGLLGLTT